jgi:CRP/FNR family transcriptional regulator, cyclic AMP receptor protein
MTLYQAASQRVQCLSAADIFCDLSADEMAVLARRAPVRHVEPKTLIYTPLQPTEVMFFLNEGRVQLYQLGTDGRMLTSGLIQSGTLFGEMTLLGQTLHGHYAHAVTACVLCVMTVSDVHDLLLSDVRISNRLVYSLGQRLLDTQRQLSVITFKPVLHRVAWALLHLAGHDMQGVQTTHETIASMVGATRETVTKALNDMEKQKWITLARGQIRLVDPAALTALADE